MKRLEREKTRKRKTSMMRSMLWVKVQILLPPLPFEGEGRRIGVCNMRR